TATTVATIVVLLHDPTLQPGEQAPLEEGQLDAVPPDRHQRDTRPPPLRDAWGPDVIGKARSKDRSRQFGPPPPPPESSQRRIRKRRPVIETLEAKATGAAQEPTGSVPVTPEQEPRGPRPESSERPQTA